MKLDLERRIRSQHIWILGVSIGLSVSACIVVWSRSLLQPATITTTTQSAIEIDDASLIYQNQEPVGWVFGRVIGFQGADKPLLPRQRLFPHTLSVK